MPGVPRVMPPFAFTAALVPNERLYRTEHRPHPCPECGGDGTLTDFAARTVWRDGAPYPRDEEVPCVECEGEGMIEVETMILCGHPASECACTDDELEALAEREAVTA